MKDKVVQITFYVLLAALIATGMFFIIHNATWLVGDDSACIIRTGWEIPYSLSDYTIPESGRFYPLAFVMYNILPVLGLSSVKAHFALHAIVFSLMLLCMCWVSKKSMSEDKPTVRMYVTLLAVVAICFARSYRYFLTTEWSLWVDYFLVVVWALCTYYIHEKQSIVAAIIGFVAITYFCYCLEVNSALPFSYGVIGLVLCWKRSTKLEKAYYASMIATALLYFVLYYILIWLHLGDDIYDASHGVSMSIFEVALRMFFAQKIFWVGIVLLCPKLWMIWKKKADFEWWDNLILAGFAYAGGCVVMHLHHTVYYWTAALCMLPAVVHYLHQWIGEKWTMVIMLLLACIMCRKLPHVIKENQSDRKASVELQQIFVNEINAGKTIYYYMPYAEDDGSNPYEHRLQKYQCLPAYIGNAIGNHDYRFDAVESFSGTPGIYILPEENETLCPAYNDEIISAGTSIFSGGYGNLTLVEVE